MRKIWTKNECLEISKLYKGRKELKDNNRSVYRISLKNSWLDEFYGKNNNKPQGYWLIKENCYNASKNVLNKSEYSKKYNNAYRISLKNSWLDEFFIKKIKLTKVRKKSKNGYWNNFELCKKHHWNLILV